MMRRRSFLATGSAALLAACGGLPETGSRPSPAFRPVPDAGWSDWVAGFRTRALAGGIAPATFDRAFQGAGFLPGVIERDRNQTEFTRTLEDYLSIMASDERIGKGRAAMARNAGALAAIEERFGVDRYVVTAVWGVESLYGERMGEVPVISAMSTLAYEGRRASFFESQLVAALKIVQAGDVAPGQMTGSWAGAMGHTQFIPTSYLAYAVDFRGDGHRDIWSSDPTDALASTANYLARSGWVRGQPWGIEVRVPAGYSGTVGRAVSLPMESWIAAGIVPASGGALPRQWPAALIRPSGAIGPAFLIFQNFNVIARYNNSESYVIGVGHLSDRLRGGPPIQAAFAPDATGLTKADRQELQTRLTRLGFDTEGTDGVIGARTRAAISAYQRSRGLAETGEPSTELLARLRNA